MTQEHPNHLHPAIYSLSNQRLYFCPLEVRLVRLGHQVHLDHLVHRGHPDPWPPLDHPVTLKVLLVWSALSFVPDVGMLVLLVLLDLLDHRGLLGHQDRPVHLDPREFLVSWWAVLVWLFYQEQVLLVHLAHQVHLVPQGHLVHPDPRGPQVRLVLLALLVFPELSQ